MINIFFFNLLECITSLVDVERYTIIIHGLRTHSIFDYVKMK